MKKFCIVAGMLLICALSFGAPKKNSVKEWQTRYNEGAKLFGSMNAKMLSQYLTSDWKSIGPDGKVMEQGNDPVKLQKQFDALKSMHVVFHVMNVKHVGSDILVHSSTSMTMITKPGPDKKTHEIVDKSLAEDTWVKQGAKWMMKQTKAIKDHMTMDGKPYKMPNMG